MIIGITCGTGCGKTTLLELIGSAGGLILDCDAIYHRLLREDAQLVQTIDESFPGTVTDGVLDRKKLGSIVFSDSDALQTLNRITHAAVKEEVVAALSQKPSLAAIDAIGLFEGGLAPLCDVTVAVTAPTENRIQRLMERDGIDRAYAQSRIAAQKPESFFRSNCTYILENNGSKQDFYRQCLAFLQDFGIMKQEI